MIRGLAEQPLAGDGEQPTLLRRFGCSPRLKRSVRLLPQYGRGKMETAGTHRGNPAQ